MKKKVRVRSIILGGLFTLFFVLLVAKLYWVQVVDASWLLQKAERSWKESEVLLPKRGSILDRNDQILAHDADAYTVAVNPLLIHEQKTANEVVEVLAPLLNMNGADGRLKLMSIVTKKTESGAFYAQREIRNEGWKISKSTADQIREAIKERNLQGIYLMPEQIRFYPSNQLASHVLGYVNKEGKAVTGVELYYDDVLKGTPGSISFKKDKLGYELPNSKATYHPPVDGQNLRLTIDQNIQNIVEEALAKSYDKFKPKSAMAVAVDPKTLEVLGMANFPDFNPNKYWEFDHQSDFINRNISSQYEPGSTFKIVTLAGAVEEGIFHPEEKYQSGSIKVPGWTLHDYNNWGEISFLEGLKRSSNVAFVKLGYEGLGPQKLEDYIRNFGFGVQTGIDLPGEIGGVIGMKYPSEYATATYGQGKVAVTPIQQVAAISAIANGGNLMQPHVVKDILDPETGRVVQSFEPKVVRRVLSPEAARQTSLYLEQVVSDQVIGTGRNAYIDGYRVAGKTGTANVVIDGQYAEAKYVVSFIGYAPVEDPRVVVCVIVVEPDLQSLGLDWHSGGEATTPVFKEIVSNTLRYLGVPSSHQAKEQLLVRDRATEVPETTGFTVSEAKNALSSRHLSPLVLGNGDRVMSQYPKAGEKANEGQRVYLLSRESAGIALPDLTGQSMRDALEVCSLLEVECSFSGEGYVVNQTVSAADGVRSALLTLEPPDVVAAGEGGREGQADGEDQPDQTEQADGQTDDQAD